MRDGYDRGLELLRKLDEEVGDWEYLAEDDVRLLEVRKAFNVREDKKGKQGSDPRYRLKCINKITGEVKIYEAVKGFSMEYNVHVNNIYSAISRNRTVKGWRFERLWNKEMK